jgi:hypothetical protein
VLLLRRLAFQRCFALVLCCSLLSGLVAPLSAHVTDDEAPSAAYADWLRGLLREAPTPALDAALDAAADAPAASLGAFLDRVVASYAPDAETPLSAFFLDTPLSDKALVRWIAAHQQGVGADFAVLPRLESSVHTPATTSRTLSAATEMSLARFLAPLRTGATVGASCTDAPEKGRCLLRQPRAP